MLLFPVKLKKPNFGPIWRFFTQKNPKAIFVKYMFYPIFSLHAAVTLCNKLEKFNASISYKTQKTHFGPLPVKII